MKLRYLYLTALLLLAPLFVSCTSNPNGGETPETDSSTSGERSDVIAVFPVDSASSGNGAKNPRIFVTDSLESLQNVPGLRGEFNPQESTSGGEEGAAYIAALWGEKRTGGYTMEVGSARLSGETVTVVLRLQEPPEGAIVSQAITYPYSVFGLSGIDPAVTEFVFEDQKGRELDWPVRNLSGS